MHRLDQIGRDDDDELGLVALERSERNSAPRIGMSPSQRHLGDVLLGGVLQQAGQRKAFAAAELDRGLGAAHRQGRDRDGCVAVIGTETAPMVVSSLTSGRTRRLR